MATIEIRDYSLPGQFARNAQTIIPPIPVAGTAYRNPEITQAQLEIGQAYSQIGASAFWNQVMFLATGIARLSEQYAYIPWSPYTFYSGGLSWCMGIDGMPYHCVKDCGPATAANPGLVAVQPPNDEYWETLPTFIRNNGGGGGGGGGGGDTVVGDIRLWGFRPVQLPAGWYFCNGEQYLLSSEQGQALASLSAEFRSDWGIIVTGTTASLPMLFSGSKGLFFRAVNGTARLPGTIEQDAMRSITATTASTSTATNNLTASSSSSHSLRATSSASVSGGGTVSSSGSLPAPYSTSTGSFGDSYVSGPFSFTSTQYRFAEASDSGSNHAIVRRLTFSLSASVPAPSVSVSTTISGGITTTTSISGAVNVTTNSITTVHQTGTVADENRPLNIGMTPAIYLGV